MKESKKMKVSFKKKKKKEKRLSVDRSWDWPDVRFGWEFRVRRGEVKEEEGVCAHLRHTFVLNLSCLLHYSLAVRGSYSGSRPFRRY